LMVLRGGLKR